jgi:hypothetical protein
MPNRIKYPVIDGQKFCAGCEVLRPIEEFKPYGNHFMPKCKACVKLYAASYRRRPEVKQAAAEYVRKYRSIPANRQSINERTKKWRSKPYTKVKRNETRRKWTAKEKQRAVEYMGGKCVCCGYSKCLHALEFHHLDPQHKETTTGGGIVPHWTLERNKKELAKCVLVCVRCHREIHAGVRHLE